MKRNISKLQLAFTLIELLVVISIIAILASIALPTFTKVIEQGNQTKDLSNAKQIYLGLKLYSGDNDGVFPGADAANANVAFRELIPNYVPTEKVFYLAKSAWTPRAPDEDYSGANNLIGGENNFAYVKGLTDTSNPSIPIIADGFSTGAVGTYSADETAPGGVWKGRKAVVVRVDGSGKVENCNASYQVVGPVGTGTGNIFTTTGTNWLSTGGSQVAINPEAPAAP